MLSVGHNVVTIYEVEMALCYRYVWVDENLSVLRGQDAYNCGNVTR